MEQMETARTRPCSAVSCCTSRLIATRSAAATDLPSISLALRCIIDTQSVWLGALKLLSARPFVIDTSIDTLEKTTNASQRNKMASVAVVLRQNVKVAATSAVCEEARLYGTVAVGRQCVVHPKCEIRALAAPIVLGDRNVLEDRVVLESPSVQPTTTDVESTSSEESDAMMVIGSGNLFESGSVVRASFVGNNNWFEPKATALEGSVIGNNCLIGSGVIVQPLERVPDNTVIVCVEDASGRLTRVVRAQKDYLLAAHRGLVQKYIDTFLDAKSVFALEKNHRLVPVLPDGDTP